MFERNPKINLFGETWQFIGDPHMGRQFSQVSPQTQKKLAIKQLEELQRLMQIPARYRCVVGDLFDKPHVPEWVIMQMIELLDDPNTFILRGNHDESKSDLDKSSFDLLQHTALASRCVREEPMLFHDGKLALCGWSFKKTLLEQLEGLRPEVIVTHLDRLDYGSGSKNVIPFTELEARGVKRVINGHEHKPYQGWYESLEYIGTGSLLPYTHAEDPEQQLFVTLTKEQLLEQPDKYSEHFVRVLGEDLSGLEDFKCLALQLKKPQTIEAQDLVLEVANYSTSSLLREIATQRGLPEHRIVVLQDMIEEANND